MAPTRTNHSESSTASTRGWNRHYKTARLARARPLKFLDYPEPSPRQWTRLHGRLVRLEQSSAVTASEGQPSEHKGAGQQLKRTRDEWNAEEGHDDDDDQPLLKKARPTPFNAAKRAISITSRGRKGLTKEPLGPSATVSKSSTVGPPTDLIGDHETILENFPRKKSLDLTRWKLIMVDNPGVAKKRLRHLTFWTTPRHPDEILVAIPAPPFGDLGAKRIVPEIGNPKKRKSSGLTSPLKVVSNGWDSGSSDELPVI